MPVAMVGGSMTVLIGWQMPASWTIPQPLSWVQLQWVGSISPVEKFTALSEKQFTGPASAGLISAGGRFNEARHRAEIVPHAEAAEATHPSCVLLLIDLSPQRRVDVGWSADVKMKGRKPPTTVWESGKNGQF
jgi:hypothetical protein